MMLIKRITPSRVGARVMIPRSQLASGVPVGEKIALTATRANGRATIDRFNEKPNPRPAKSLMTRIQSQASENAAQLPSGRSALESMKNTVTSMNQYKYFQLQDQLSEKLLEHIVLKKSMELVEEKLQEKLQTC